ncbi:hypothetical protein BDZ89DRAFT_1129935 [Hymenopellis radicata]|nr:hypothetical protein BDZ89DRAFT_1129935 [Hymenopellis radicata]
MSTVEHDIDSTLSMNKPSARHLLSVVTSIAAICVREPSEVFACSLAISPGSLKIYLAENHSIPPATSAYLDGILTRLVDISEDPNASDDDSLRKPVMAILAVVLEFTLPKFLHSISKHNANWDARMADIEKLVLSDDERSAFLKLQERIDVRLGTSLNYLRALVLKSPTRMSSLPRSKKSMFASPLDAEAVMAEDLDPESMSQGFSLTRYVARMLSIIVHVMRLVKLAVSPTYKDLFTRARPPTIQYLTPVPRSVLIDTGAALQFLADSPDDSSDTFSSTDDTIHRLENRLLKDALEGPPGGLSPYWVIGTSKLMCAGCYTTIARAYPKVLQDHETIARAYPKVLQDHESQLRKLKPFLVQGSHGKVYAPWIPPTLSNLDELVGFDFDRRVKSATLDIMKDDLMTIVNSRRLAAVEDLRMEYSTTQETKQTFCNVP